MIDPKELSSIGPYKFYHVIGEGSFSVVRTAMMDDSDKIFAVKIIPKVRLAERQLAARFQLEIRVMQCLHHPSIIQIHDIFKDKKFYYVVMEYCSGGSFSDFIVNNRRLNEDDCKFYMHQIFSAMKFIHDLKICHRDLKPQNILLDASKKSIKISDFGLSKFVFKNKLTSTPVGSLIYASPECLSGNPYDPIKSDIWSCGVIMYIALTGKSPWIGQKSTHVMAQIKKGHYEMPSYLTTECKRLLHAILTTDAQSRPTDSEILNFDWFKTARPLSSRKLSMPDTEFHVLSIRSLDNFFGRDLKSSAFTDSFDNLFKSIDESEDLLLPPKSIQPYAKKKPDKKVKKQMKIEKTPSVLSFEVDFDHAMKVMTFNTPELVLKKRESKTVGLPYQSSSHDCLQHINESGSAHKKLHTRAHTVNKKGRTSSHSILPLVGSDLADVIREGCNYQSLTKNRSVENQLETKKPKRQIPLANSTNDSRTTSSEMTYDKKTDETENSTQRDNDSSQNEIQKTNDSDKDEPAQDENQQNENNTLARDEKPKNDDQNSIQKNDDNELVQDEIPKKDETKDKKDKKDKKEKKKKKHAFTLPRLFKKKSNPPSNGNDDDNSKSDDSQGIS